jgi:hypothetical protein
MLKLYWNDAEVTFRDEREAIYCTFLNCARRVKFQNGLNTKEFLVGICSMFQEVLVSEEKDTKNEIRKKELVSLLRKLSLFSKMINHMELKYFNGERAQLKIFNFLLSMDGLSTLPGFGFSNHHNDKLKGNSEKAFTLPSKYKESVFQEIK